MVLRVEVVKVELNKTLQARALQAFLRVEQENGRATLRAALRHQEITRALTVKTELLDRLPRQQERTIPQLQQMPTMPLRAKAQRQALMAQRQLNTITKSQRQSGQTQLEARAPHQQRNQQPNPQVKRAVVTDATATQELARTLV